MRSLISRKITEIFQRDADILICHTERTEIMLCMCVCVCGKLEWLSCPRKFIAAINRSHLQMGGRNNPFDWGEGINDQNVPYITSTWATVCLRLFRERALDDNSLWLFHIEVWQLIQVATALAKLAYWGDNVNVCGLVYQLLECVLSLIPARYQIISSTRI